MAETHSSAASDEKTAAGQDVPPGQLGTIGGHMARGAAWMVAMRWSLKLIGLLNTAIIARLLTPSDFGVMAMAMVLADFVTTLADGDVEMALVRSRTAGRAEYDTAWTVKILSGLLVGGVIFAASPLLASFYNDERVLEVGGIVALRAAILGLENIGAVDFRRQLNFAGEFRYMVLTRMVNLVTGLALVLWFRDWHALAWFCPVSAAVTVVISFLLIPYRPRLSLQHFGWLWRFSQWQILFNSARMLGERCDQFVIGKLGSALDVGNYYVAYDIAMMPTREIMFPVGRALLPNYARLAHDETAMNRAFREVLGFAGILSLAVGVGLSVVAEDAVLVMLGSQWEGAVPFFRLLGLFGALEGLWLMLDPYLIARHQERLLAMVNLAFALLVVPGVVLAALGGGISAIPEARLAAMAALLLVVLGIFWRRGWISLGDLGRLLWRPVLAALGMALAVRLAHHDFGLPLLSLLLDALLGGVCFTGLLLGSWLLAGRPVGAESLLLGRLGLGRLVRSPEEP